MSTPSNGGPPASGPASSPDEITGGSGEAVSVADIAATLSQERPEVQPHAIEQARAEAAANVKVDSAGTPFDSARHTGSVLKDGTWRLKSGQAAKPGERSPRGRKVESKLGAVPGTTTPAQAQAYSKEQTSRASGAAAANLLMALGVGLGGDEWHPRKDDKIGLDEKAMLEACFGDYFVATGKTDLPPGWALVAGVSMYALPRFAMPKTRSRLARVKNWFSAKIVAYRARKAGLRVTVRADQSAEQQS